MADRDWSEDPITLQQPPGAGPDDPAIIIFPQPIPPELVTYYTTGFGYVVHAAILYRLNSTNYTYDAWIAQSLGANPLLTRGVVVAGAVHDQFSVGNIGGTALVIAGFFEAMQFIIDDAASLLDILGDLSVARAIFAPRYLAVQTVVTTDDLAFTQTTYSTNQSCGHSFVAPQSGRVRVDWAVRMEPNTAGVRVLASFNIRDGATVGTGTLRFTAGDGTAIESAILERIQAGSSYIHAGLTDGNTYNVEIVYKVSAAGNGDMFDQRVITTPLFG